jgi:hypothetical protein
MHKRTILALVVTVLSGCSAQRLQYLSQPEAISVAGEYVHQPSDFTFKFRSGDFVRAGVYKYDTEGKHIGVAYNLNNISKPVAATIYVYPSPSIMSIGSPRSVIASARKHLCKQEYEATVKEIIAAHANSKQVDKNNSSSDDFASGVGDLSAYFEYEGVFAGVKQALSSEFKLTCYLYGNDEDWNVKYRVTYPKSLAVDSEIEKFQNAVPIL